MSENLMEKRRKYRTDVEQRIEVLNSITNKLLGKVVNISEDGFMLISHDAAGEIKENCLYQLKFILAKDVDGVSDISLGAECLWLNETGAGEQLWCGFQVIDISDSDRDIMHLLGGDID